MTIREEAAEWAKKNRPSGLLAQVIAAEAYESAFDGETVRALVEALQFYAQEEIYKSGTGSPFTAACCAVSDDEGFLAHEALKKIRGEE